MSDIECNSCIEYNPCIRKGKQSKKHKKYEPKAQKRNITRRHKSDQITQITQITQASDSLTELIEILNTENMHKWNCKYDQMYKEYNLGEIEECKRGYLNIQRNICKEYWNICKIVVY